MASIIQLANDLKLSKGTVSRILNDATAPYNAKTRHRVLTRAAEMGYHPNPVARALATGRTDTVALWTRHLQNFYQSWVINSLSRQTAAGSFNLLIRLYGQYGPTISSPASDSVARPFVLSDSVDGVITHGVPPDEWLARFRGGSRPVPIVVTGGVPSPEIPDFVGLELCTAARAAVEHLVGMGLRRIALFALPNPEDRRNQAYISVMEAAGLPQECIPLREGTRTETRRQFREYVTACGHPEAVFCHNDDTAIAVYRALCDLGLRVPDDVALVGCDGIEDTEFLPVPITTIVQPVEEMSRIAWEFLQRRLQEPDAPPQQHVLEARLEIRASSQK
ncbi:MAG: LacI family DNA-binding transcriptional regulator [Armatimonadota bacterium]